MVVTSYANSFENVIGFTFKYEGSGLDVTSNHSRYGVSKETIKSYNKKYKTSYSEIIIQITFEKLKPNIVGGQVYFNNEELKKVFKIKN